MDLTALSSEEIYSDIQFIHTYTYTLTMPFIKFINCSLHRELSNKRGNYLSFPIHPGLLGLYLVDLWSSFGWLLVRKLFSRPLSTPLCGHRTPHYLVPTPLCPPLLGTSYSNDIPRLPFSSYLELDAQLWHCMKSGP